MSEKKLLRNEAQKDLEEWFYRYPVSHVIREIIGYADANDLEQSAEGTYRKVLEGHAAYNGAVDVVYAFWLHVRDNLRQYIFPEEVPDTREEAAEWVKKNGKATYFYRAVKDKIGHSSYGSFFIENKSMSDTFIDTVLSGLREWRAWWVPEFERWESRHERYNEWRRLRKAIVIEIHDEVKARLLAQYGEEQLKQQWLELATALCDCTEMSRVTVEAVNMAAGRLRRASTIDEIAEVFSEIEADKIAVERHGECPLPEKCPFPK